MFKSGRQRPETQRKMYVHSWLYQPNEVSSTFDNRFVEYPTVSHTPQKNPEHSISFQCWDNRHSSYLNQDVRKTIKKILLSSGIFFPREEKHTISVCLAYT